MQNPEDLRTYENIKYEKNSISNEWGEDGLTNKYCQDNKIDIWEKKIKLDPYFTPYIKINTTTSEI